MTTRTLSTTAYWQANDAVPGHPGCKQSLLHVSAILYFAQIPSRVDLWPVGAGSGLLGFWEPAHLRLNSGQSGTSIVQYGLQPYLSSPHHELFGLSRYQVSMLSDPFRR